MKKGYELIIKQHKTDTIIAKNKVFETLNEAKTFAISFLYFTRLEVDFSISNIEVNDNIDYVWESLK